MRETLVRMLTVLSIAVLCSYTASGQDGRHEGPECETTGHEEIKYRVIYADRGIREPFTLGLRIVVGKKQIIDRDFMLALAKSVRRRYCRDDNIAATIFDDKEVAKTARAIVDHLLEKRHIPEIRGFYSFDRQRNIDKVSFYSTRGKPLSEIVVDLTSNLSSR